MKRASIIIILLIAVAVAGWYAFGGGDKTQASQSVNAPVVAIGVLQQHPADYVGKVVTVEGQVSRECPAGCWWYVKDNSGEIRACSPSKGVVLPLHQIGKKVRTTSTIIKNGDGTLELDAIAAAIVP